MSAAYDIIGANYADLRRPDARIAVPIWAALGAAQRILNVGAGSGSYEPTDRDVTALEPSGEMIRQRSVNAAPVVQGHAENLPFEDKSFDAVMAVLTVHHWTNKAKGMQEMRRVARGPIVILTFDPAFRDNWLLDYFPELAVLDEGQMPPIEHYEGWLGRADIFDVPIPHDCCDGFLAAYWRRPHAYLDSRVRAAMSSFWKIGDTSAALGRLEEDLNSGVWHKRYGDLLALEAIDCGYRLVVAK